MIKVWRIHCLRVGVATGDRAWQLQGPGAKASRPSGKLKSRTSGIGIRWRKEIRRESSHAQASTSQRARATLPFFIPMAKI